MLHIDKTIDGGTLHMDIPILYEDNHLLVVQKPVNIPVQEDKTGDKDLLTLLKEDIKVRYNKPGNVYLGLVHRLDRPVGGVMVFAKTSKAASRLSDMIRRQAMDRKYLTIVRGGPNEERGVLKHNLLKNHQKNIVSVVPATNKNGKEASLDYELVKQGQGLSLLAVRLHTGRPHQIRVQLAEEGMPIYGDQKYGQHVNKPGQQIALWSNEISFKHPTKEDIVTIDCSPPNQFPWNI